MFRKRVDMGGTRQWLLEALDSELESRFSIPRFSLSPASSSSVGVSSAKRVSLAIFSTVFLLMKVVERSSGIFL